MGEEGTGAPGVGWWRASDGEWYPPETHPEANTSAADRLGRHRPGADLGRAGSSAAAEAERLAELAERYRAEAANWSKGAHGERLTAERLATLPSAYVVLHDLHVPGSKANVDHLIIGPTGVFVVDSKAYTGTYTDGSGTLWQGKRPIRQEVDTVEFIAARLSEHLDVPVRTILCFTEAVLPRQVTELGATRAVTLPAVCEVITGGAAVHNENMVSWLVRLAGELVEPTMRNATVGARTATPTVPRAMRRSTRASRPPKASAPKSHRATRTMPRRKKKSVVPGLLALGALLLALRFLPEMAGSIGDGVAERVAPTSTAPASVGMTFACPAPGGGYTGTPVYPPNSSSFRVYEIAVVFDGNEIYRDRWELESAPPPPLEGLWPGIELLVTTTTKDAVPVSAEQVVTVPSEPC